MKGVNGLFLAWLFLLTLTVLSEWPAHDNSFSAVDAKKCRRRGQHHNKNNDYGTAATTVAASDETAYPSSETASADTTADASAAYTNGYEAAVTTVASDATTADTSDGYATATTADSYETASPTATGYAAETSPAAYSSNNATYGASNGQKWDFKKDKAYGVNLGNWLILESWMSTSWFNSVANGGTDEWTLSQNLGQAKAKEVLTQHWNTWVTEKDFVTMSQYGINFLRIPVGFWAFIGCTSEEPYVTSGQLAQLNRILGYADKYNMYVLLDLHGAPGSQNGQDHSGHAGNIGFFTTTNINRGLKAVQAMVDWAKASPYSSRIAAIQPVNEPHPYVGDRWNQLVKFTKDSYKIINAGGFAMVFHDGFQGLNRWSGVFTNGENAIIDLHPYWAFSGSQTQDKVIGEVCALGSQYASFHLPVFAGEFSVAATDVQGSQWWYKRFWTSEWSQFNQGAGGTFWAMKTVGNTPWSFLDLVSQGAIPKSPSDLSASGCSSSNY